MAVTGQVILSQVLLAVDAQDQEFEAAVREHSRYVYHVVQAVLRNHHDAEDAVQETFLRYFQQRRHWAPAFSPAEKAAGNEAG